MTTSTRIVHLEPIPDWIRGIYDSAFDAPHYDLIWASDRQDTELGDFVSGADILITGKRRITETVLLAAGANVRLIQVIGRAPWAVDLDRAGEAGIPVSFLPHGGAIAVAEHTFALMLGLYRKLVSGHLGTAHAEYERLELEPIRTSERVIAFNWLELSGVQQLHGKTLGLVGLGDIGLEVVRRARAFDMTVLYTKRSPLPAEYERLVGVRFKPMTDLLELSDVVSLHAPHTPQTEGLIDAGALSHMRKTAVLVNTARGGLVDEQALVAALRDESIAGAGLDVFVDEPLPAGHALLDLQNVLLSPHLGGGTGGGQKGMVNEIKSNVERTLRGETPHHLVSP